MLKTFFFLFLILQITLLSQSYSQESESSNALYGKLTLSVKKDSLYTLLLPKKASSVNFSILPNANFENAYLIVEKDTFSIEPEEHSTSEELNFSSLIVFKKPADKIKIYSGVMIGELNVYLNYLSPISTEKNTHKKKANARTDENCFEPLTIPPSIWRVGLPTPIEDPDSTEVKHIIVHHSAGSNENENFTDVVRNIYIFHTKPVLQGGRGYNDIAYNFLIAQDGTIFQGRDDKKLYQKDNIQGAHMCAKNKNTMGICLLGNFMEMPPSPDMIHSLNEIIAWKLLKENIAPFSYLWHPIIAPDRPLQNIAGHRQGCGTNDTSAYNTSYTLCPGNYVMPLMPQIRQNAFERIVSCQNLTSIQNSTYSTFAVYPTTVGNYLSFKGGEQIHSSIKITDIFGKECLKHAIETENQQIDVSSLPSGIYFLSLFNRDQTYVSKFVKE